MRLIATLALAALRPGCDARIGGAAGGRAEAQQAAQAKAQEERARAQINAAQETGGPSGAPTRSSRGNRNPPPRVECNTRWRLSFGG